MRILNGWVYVPGRPDFKTKAIILSLTIHNLNGSCQATIRKLLKSPANTYSRWLAINTQTKRLVSKDGITYKEVCFSVQYEYHIVKPWLFFTPSGILFVDLMVPSYYLLHLSTYHWLDEMSLLIDAQISNFLEQEERQDFRRHPGIPWTWKKKINS